MARKKLPTGIQTFDKIRNSQDEFIYVDKTEIAYKLINKGQYFFLSRPRRFGKSLFVDTLSEIFKGHKHLFKGLYIEDKWDWEQTHPVIKINFANGDFSSSKNISAAINQYLLNICRNLKIDPTICYHEQVGLFFENIIFEAYHKYNTKVVILIDEYDKAIIDNFGNEDSSVALQARQILRSFYSTIKGADEYLRFVFITGVSKFSKLNLFSGLNNIEDITIDAEFSTITGYTHTDIQESFKDYIEEVDLNKLKKWYNGYNYFGTPVYNPYDILLFFSKGNIYDNYWWETGNPKFLIDILKESRYYLPDLENIETTKEVLNTFDVDNIGLVALLWQTGYLTFKSKRDLMGINTYTMKVPNLEIQNSLNALFTDYLTNLHTERIPKAINTSKALLERDIPRFVTELKALFAAIPYDNYVNNNMGTYEGYYASVIFAFLSSLGFEVITEDHTNKGRIDMTLIGPDAIYILEFKVDVPAETAIKQIEDKKYYEKYTSQEKEIFLIGMHFDSNEKNIGEVDWRKAPNPKGETYEHSEN